MTVITSTCPLTDAQYEALFVCSYFYAIFVPDNVHTSVQSFTFFP